VPAAIALAAAIVGAIVAWAYHRLGLTLSHYDAPGIRGRAPDRRQHHGRAAADRRRLVGRCRILLNAIPVTVDFFYRTGASSVAISIRRLCDRDRLRSAGSCWR